MGAHSAHDILVKETFPEMIILKLTKSTDKPNQTILLHSAGFIYVISGRYMETECTENEKNSVLRRKIST